LAFGVNYGYVGNATPEVRTIIDALGSWPWRVVVMAGLVCLVYAAMLVPWDLARWLRRGGPRGGPRDGDGDGDGGTR
jgi:uncharacterized membrane protein YwaF